MNEMLPRPQPRTTREGAKPDRTPPGLPLGDCLCVAMRIASARQGSVGSSARRAPRTVA
jgi:hypothetical protein